MKWNIFDSIVVRPAMIRPALIIAAALASASSCKAESGLASYYGGIGHRGELTCAHRTRPLGSFVTVSHGGRSIRCRVNDRGPFVRGRVIDVSLSAARALGMIGAGVVRVSVE
jgi:rare lipoprotein A